MRNREGFTLIELLAVIVILGILAIGLCYILNSIYSFIQLDRFKDDSMTEKEKQKAVKEVMTKFIMILIPQLIIAVVFCFTQWAQLLSFGMTMFWGIIISLVYNILLNKIIE